MKLTLYRLVALVSLLALSACSSAATPTVTPVPPPPPTSTPAPLTSTPAPPTSTPAPPTSTPAPVVGAPKPANASVRISTPKQNDTLPVGDVIINVAYTGPTLLAGADAKQPTDYHLDYLLDTDPTPYIGTTKPIPAGSPSRIHTAASSVTFKAVPAGSHTVTVILTGQNDISVSPSVSDHVTFTVK